jgi:Predicted ATPases
MARLEHVAVEGFKGVERVEFDPGMVNVVTGRNNSGKTSLLEAVDLGCDPTGVERFGGSHASLIRESRDTARVTLATADDERRVELSVPDESDAERMLWEEVQRRLSEVVDRIRKQVKITADSRTAVASITETLVEEIDAQRHVMSVSMNGDSFTYV